MKVFLVIVILGLSAYISYQNEYTSKCHNKIKTLRADVKSYKDKINVLGTHNDILRYRIEELKNE